MLSSAELLAGRQLHIMQAQLGVCTAACQTLRSYPRHRQHLQDWNYNNVQHMHCIGKRQPPIAAPFICLLTETSLQQVDRLQTALIHVLQVLEAEPLSSSAALQRCIRVQPAD